MRYLRSCVACLPMFLFVSVALGQSEEISVEWIYSAAPWQIAATEECEWLADGTLLIGRADGGFDHMNPKTEEDEARFKTFSACMNVRGAGGAFTLRIAQ